MSLLVKTMSKCCHYGQKKGGFVMGKRCLVFIVFLYVLSAAVPSMAELHWYSLDEGLKMAASEHKPVIIDFFYGKGCPRCESLQKNVYNNSAIAKKISDSFVPVRIDLTKKLSAEEMALGKQYDFKNDCLLLFLDHNAKIIKGPAGKKLCFVDSIEPEQFIQYLDMVLEGYKSDSGI
jgi:thioredoxin-related protein